MTTCNVDCIGTAAAGRMKRMSYKKRNPLLLSLSLLHILLMLLVVLASICITFPQPTTTVATTKSAFNVVVVHAMKHTFTIQHTSRSMIGPIGQPFGFNANGYYEIIVSDFYLTVFRRKGSKKNTKSKGKKKQDVTTNDDIEILQQYEAGFFLQRYPNIASFHQHYNALYFHNQNTTAAGTTTIAKSDTSTTAATTAIPQQQQAKCAFESFLASHDGSGTRQLQHDDDDFMSNMNDPDNPTDDTYVYDDATSSSPRDDDMYSSYSSYSNYNSDSNDDTNDDPTITSTTKSTKNTAASPMMIGGEYNTAKDGIYVSMKSMANTWKPKSVKVSYRFKPGEEGLYFLMYQICPTPPSRYNNGEYYITSTYTLDIKYYNIDMLGHKSYLPAGEMKLPSIYLFYTMSYALCCWIWMSNIRLIQRGQYGHFYKPSSIQQQQQSIPVLHHIHQLMTLVLLLKFGSMMLESMRYFIKKITGHANLWSVLYTIVSCINILFFFTVLVLLGTGWSIVTPFVVGRVRYMILLVLLLQIVNNIAIVVLSQETDGETYYQTWLGILHIMDIICCCIVLLPIVWQIQELETNAGIRNIDSDDNNNDSTNHSSVVIENDVIKGDVANPTTSRTSAILNKLKLFRTFYMVVVAYIYTTRIIIYLFTSMLSYKYIWVQYFVVELVTLTFYVVVGILFRPVPEDVHDNMITERQQQRKHQYSNNDDDDDDDDVLSINSERQALTGKRTYGNGIELQSLQRADKKITITGDTIKTV